MTRLPALFLLAALSLAACADEGPVSGPGTLTATLVSPNGPEGAALVELVGENIGAITALGDTEVFSESDGGSTQVVLVNQSGGALSFWVAVADTTAPPSAVVHQVSGPDDQLRATLDGYALEFGR